MNTFSFLDLYWSQIALGQYRSPTGQSMFEVIAVLDDHVLVRTARSQHKIPRKAFEEVLNYLDIHGHHDNNHRCRIGSNKSIDKAGPLDQVARHHGRMEITYVLPILASIDLVEIDPSWRSTTWLKRVPSAIRSAA